MSQWQKVITKEPQSSWEHYQVAGISTSTWESIADYDIESFFKQGYLLPMRALSEWSDWFTYQTSKQGWTIAEEGSINPSAGLVLFTNERRNRCSPCKTITYMCSMVYILQSTPENSAYMLWVRPPDRGRTIKIVLAEPYCCK